MGRSIYRLMMIERGDDDGDEGGGGGEGVDKSKEGEVDSRGDTQGGEEEEEGVRSSHRGSDGEARGKQLGVMSSLGTTD
uniref:Uncharacterized protein n=1 Tax=Setaria digitata TaxID=48799 RepID=A0A915Q1P4_9BILA